MKIIATSDLHGTLPEIKTEFDLLLICGDICPVWNHNRHYQEEWLNTDFADWIKSLPYKNALSRVVCIAGNHDFYLEGAGRSQMTKFKNNCGNQFVYLRNGEYDFEYLTDRGLDTIRIFGTPYCKPFGSWAFMRENLSKYYDEIPEGIDILISHDAADINEMGYIHEGRWSGTNAGNKALADCIKRVKPKYYFCGHIHSGNHKFEDIDGVKCANVSLMNERYSPENEILMFEYGE